MKNLLLKNQNTKKTKLGIIIIFLLNLILIPLNAHGFLSWGKLIKPEKDPNHNQYKIECTEILEKINKKFLSNQNFTLNPASLTQEDKKLIYSFFTYFILSDFCFVHLRDYIFDEKEKINLDQLEQEPNKLYIITGGYPHLTYYIPYIQNIKQFKSKMLKSKYCTNANNLIDLSSCLYDNKIIVTYTFGEFFRFLLPLHIAFKNNIKFLHIGLDMHYEKNKAKMTKLIKQIETSNKTYNICFAYTKEENTSLNTANISITPIITIYCPSFHIEKDFPNEPIPTFFTSYLYMLSTDLNLHPNNLNELVTFGRRIYHLFQKNPNRRNIPFTEGEKVKIQSIVNLEKQLFYYLGDQGELFDFYLDRLIYQLNPIKEMINWLRKEMTPRNVFPPTSFD
ncbi:MAG: hypothetical protein QW279_08200 [Candidatus Jordarchaeaceae archaeon]